MAAIAVQSWETAYTGSKRWFIRMFPCLTDLVFLFPAFLMLFVLQGTKALLADGDTGWHIRTGEWILAHRTVPTVDLFSFTKPHEAWFAWEWGWDVMFAGIYHAWGLSGVAFANLLLLCLISALLYRLIRRCSDNDLLAMFFTLVALLGSTIHWLARPHLFSWIFLLLFSHVLLSVENGNTRRLAWLPLLTVAWVNIHGAFFVGVLMVLIAGVGEALACFRGQAPMPWRAAWLPARPYLLCGVGCMAASFVNPYTWHLHQHVFSYLRDFKLLDEIQEYQSVNFHHGPVIFFECMLLLGLASTVWCVRERKFGAAILMIVWAHFALVSARNIPIYLFIAAPWVACMSQDALRSIGSAAGLRRVRTALADVYSELRPLERIGRWHVVSVAAVLCLCGLCAKGDPKFEADFEAKNFPVHALPALQAMKPAHIFTYDQWGDYLIYRLFPSTRVFVDGRSDFYGADFVIRCEHVVAGRYDWEQDLKRYGVDTVLLKTDAPLAEVLKESRNWSVAFDDGAAIIFRAGANRTAVIAAFTKPVTQFSSVARNGGKELGAPSGLQVDDSKSRPITHERRSL